MSLKLPVFFATLLLGAQTFAAPLSLGPKGVVVDNGVDAPLTFTYPVLSNEARKETKVADAVVTASTAVVNYEGGGKLTVQLSGDEITFNLSELPADIKHLHSVTNIGPEYRTGGKWQVGTGAVSSFPVEKPASPFLHKGGGPDFTLFGPTGVQTLFHASEYAYQQLNDNREWHADIFQWHVWIPIPAGSPSVSMKVTVSTASVGSSPAPVATVAAPASLKAPQQPSELDAAFTGTRVLKWKDGKRAPFMIEFDDSASSQLKNVIPELTKRGIPGTFYINPGNGPYKGFQSQWEKAATLPGIELANHTFTHIGGLTVEAFESEVVQCNEVLNQLYPARKTPRLISFGRPGVPKEKWGITDAQIKEVLAKNHLIERPQFIGPPFQLKTIDEMNKWVDSAITTGEMKHIVFHGVGGDWLITPLDYFAAVLDKLEANRDQLWLTDPLAYHKYLTERTSAVAKEISSSPKRIQVSLTSQADPAFYDLPLSLATRVPADWTHASVQQGASRVNVQVVDGIARYDALPGGGDIILMPAASL